MDDNIGEKLTKILQDPEGLKLITQLASGFLNNNKSDGEKGNNENKEAHEPHTEAAFSALKEASSLPVFGNSASNSREAERINFLKSLRPFLDAHRRDRVDGIVKALGAVELINRYKGEDILKTFGFK